MYYKILLILFLISVTETTKAQDVYISISPLSLKENVLKQFIENIIIYYQILSAFSQYHSIYIKYWS